MISLPQSEADKFVSPYLSTGFRDDVIEMQDVVVGDGSITGTFDVINYFEAGDGMFHLSVPIAFTAVGQLALIYAHLDNGLHEKKHEVYIHAFSVVCKRPIRDLSFGVTLTQKARRSMPAGTFYKGAVSIADGAFSGSGNFFLQTSAAHD